MDTRSYVADVCNVGLKFDVFGHSPRDRGRKGGARLRGNPSSCATSLVTSRSFSLAGTPSLSVVSTPEYVNDYVILLFAPAYTQFSGNFGALQPT